MKSFVGCLITFLREEGGTETLEWGLVCGLLIVGALAAITLIGPKINDLWTSMSSTVPPQP
jgi:Flp pilus assembly pilin Flp